MTIDRFSKERFEAALPRHKETDEPLWQCVGLVENEYEYMIPVNGTNKRIVIRSSIDRSGFAAESGKDSIRLWVEYKYRGGWHPLGKLDAWTTRVNGWERRVTEKLRELWKMAVADSKGRSVGANKPKQEKQANSQKANRLLAPTGAGDSPPETPHTPEIGSNPSPAPVFELGQVHSVEVESEPALVPASGPEPNEQQRAAIEAPVDAAVRVLAGPGAGKTFVVARRYSYLLNNGANPGDIIAVTFNKNMADELLARIIKVNPSVVGTSAENQVSTIHALCYRMLRAEGDKRQVAKEWQVKRVLQEIIEGLWPYPDDRPGYKEVLAWVNSIKMHGLTSADDLPKFSKCVDKFGRNVGRELHEARRQLDERMRRDRLLTFPDMLLDVEVRLKTDRAFREKWQARFRWVIVDEGQDTSHQAMRILSTLAQPQNQFYIVGDTDQLLYRFAGATPEANLFEGFERRYPDGILVKLETNYRSSRAIVEAQLTLIANNYEESGGPYEQKYLKTLAPRPDAPGGEPVTFTEYESPEIEAAMLVSDLVEAMANGSQPGSVFVGARTRAQLGYLEGPLTRAKIPFINIANPGGFWSSKHVQDVVAYLRLAFNEADDEAFKRVFNIASNYNTHPWGENRGEYCHHRYLGKAFLSACRESYRNVWAAASKRRSFKPGVEDLTGFIRDVQAEMAMAESPADIIRFIMDDCYKRYLQAEEGITSDDEAENGKLDDFATVEDVAREFNNVEGFLEYVADTKKAAEDARDKSWDDYVVISTVHRLKGLERDVVYGIGLSEGFISAGPAQIPAGLLPHTFSMTRPPNDGVLPTGGMGRIEDERCIAFVLVSRAKERVHLSGVRQYRKSTLHGSRFIEEMRL